MEGADKFEPVRETVEGGKGLGKLLWVAWQATNMLLRLWLPCKDVGSVAMSEWSAWSRE